MSDERSGEPNPYAPAAAVAADLDRQPVGPLGVKVAAVAAALLAGLPFMGGALFIVGKRRAALSWLAVGLAALLGLLLSTWLGLGKVYLVSLALSVASWAVVVWQTLRAKPPYPMTTARAAVLALVVVMLAQATMRLVRLLGTEAFNIPSAAMMPTLLPGDHIVVWKTRSPERGDLVVFRYPPDPKLDYIKRVVAIGGDTIEVKDNVVHINGSALPLLKLEEPCPAPTYGRCAVYEERNGPRSYRIMLRSRDGDSGPVQVPPGHVFTLGDNRHDSNDSRMWGTVPTSNLKGRTRLVWWSRGPDGMRWERLGIGVD